MVALFEKSPKSVGLIRWGSCLSVPNFKASHPIVVEIPTIATDRQPASPEWLKNTGGLQWPQWTKRLKIQGFQGIVLLF